MPPCCTPGDWMSTGAAAGVEARGCINAGNGTIHARARVFVRKSGVGRFGGPADRAYANSTKKYSDPKTKEPSCCCCCCCCPNLGFWCSNPKLGCLVHDGSWHLRLLTSTIPSSCAIANRRERERGEGGVGFEALHSRVRWAAGGGKSSR